jgi:putative transcriptional regulator
VTGSAMESLKGKLLISGGGLYDPNFRHTVVLIGEHDAMGAVGVVLNRPMETTVAKAVPALAELVDPGEPLFEGGPVAPDHAVLLLEVAPPVQPDVTIFGNVGFFTGEVSGDVKPFVQRARVFLGHAGWGPGQLEAEMEEGAWIVEDPAPDDPFTPSPDSLWSRILKRKGPPFDKLARIPFDPSMN